MFFPKVKPVSRSQTLVLLAPRNSQKSASSKKIKVSAEQMETIYLCHIKSYKENCCLYTLLPATLDLEVSNCGMFIDTTSKVAQTKVYSFKTSKLEPFYTQILKNRIYTSLPS